MVRAVAPAKDEQGVSVPFLQPQTRMCWRCSIAILFIHVFLERTSTEHGPRTTGCPGCGCDFGVRPSSILHLVMWLRGIHSCTERGRLVTFWSFCILDFFLQDFRTCFSLCGIADSVQLMSGCEVSMKSSAGQYSC